MYSDADELSSANELEVLLDGLPVSLPAGRRTLPAIRSYLDMLALGRQRILFSLSIDGHRTDLIHPGPDPASFARVEGETLELAELPAHLIRSAIQQTETAICEVRSAIVLVLINDGGIAREFWWKLAGKMKDPLLTLCLLPDTMNGAVNGVATFTQVRKWHLEHLGRVLRQVDEACWAEDSQVLSNALEHHALPWLNDLHAMLALWHETTAAATRDAAERVA
jgi:hypothetical protein